MSRQVLATPRMKRTLLNTRKESFSKLKTSQGYPTGVWLSLSAGNNDAVGEVLIICCKDALGTSKTTESQ